MLSTNKMLALQVRTKMAFLRMKESELGQTAAEYAGIVFVVVAIAVALVAFGGDIANTVKGKIDSALNGLG